MIFGRRKREKIRERIIDNLTLCRLEGDLLAVEAAIRDSAPRSASTEGSAARRFFDGLKTEIDNTLRRFHTAELSVDKERAKNALAAFRAGHKAEELELAKDSDAFAKYINKHLFKNDRDGRGRLAFALMFAIDGKDREYQFPKESLEVVSEILFDDPKKLGRLYAQYESNFIKLHTGGLSDFEIGLGIGSGLGGALALSLLPFTVTGAATLISYILKRRSAKQALASLSATEAYTTLAFGLTLIEASEGVSESDKKEMADELLERISNIRADAEYKWAVEGESVPECREKIRACELAFKRLTEILGV